MTDTITLVVLGFLLMQNQSANASTRNSVSSLYPSAAMSYTPAQSSLGYSPYMPSAGYMPNTGYMPSSNVSDAAIWNAAGNVAGAVINKMPPVNPITQIATGAASTAAKSAVADSLIGGAGASAVATPVTQGSVVETALPALSDSAASSAVADTAVSSAVSDAGGSSFIDSAVSAFTDYVTDPTNWVSW
jgi:hypothetical protein